MLASLALVPAAIGVLAPAGADEGCPSPRLVADALAAHLPGSVVPPGQPLGASTLRLGVTTDAAGVTRLDLLDPGGEILLHRSLSPAERERASDCPALAETVALIVERYWREVGYDVPPLLLPTPRPPAAQPRPPPPPAHTAAPAPVAPAATSEARAVTSTPARPEAPARWTTLASAAAVGRAGDNGSTDGALLLAVGLERRYGIRIGAGIATEVTAASAPGSANPLGDVKFRRFPFRLGGYYTFRLGPGTLEPGIGLDLDETWVDVVNPGSAIGWSSPSLCVGRVCLSPGADVSLGWSVRSARHVFARIFLQAGLEVSYRFVALDDSTVWSTPRTYLELGLELGSWFR